MQIKSTSFKAYNIKALPNGKNTIKSVLNEIESVSDTSHTFLQKGTYHSK